MTDQSVLLATEPFVLVVEPQQPPAIVLAVGDQGPPGRDAIAADLPTDPLAYYILARS